MDSPGKSRFGRNSVGMREFVSFVLRNSSEKVKLRQETLREEYCRQLGITDLTDSEKALFHDAVRDSFNTLYCNGEAKNSDTFKRAVPEQSDEDENEVEEEQINPAKRFKTESSESEVAELSLEEPSPEDKSDSDEDFSPFKKKAKASQKAKSAKGKGKVKSSPPMKKDLALKDSSTTLLADSHTRSLDAKSSPIKHSFQERAESESPLVRRTKKIAVLDRSIDKYSNESDQEEASPSKDSSGQRSCSNCSASSSTCESGSEDNKSSSSSSPSSPKPDHLPAHHSNESSSESSDEKSEENKGKCNKTKEDNVSAPQPRRDSPSSSSSSAEDDVETLKRVKKKVKESIKAARTHRPRKSSSSSQSSVENDPKPSEKKAQPPKKKCPEPQMMGNILKGSEKLLTYKRFLQKAGLASVWVHTQLARLSTEEEKIDKIMEILREAGLKGQPTLKKCEVLRLAREEAQELQSLDPSNIISSEGRTSRRTKVSSSRHRSSSSEDNSRNMFSSLKGVVDSEDSSDN